MCIKVLDKLYDTSLNINIDTKSKYVIMSDCHRGDGGNDDNFLDNEVIYNAALKNYFKNDFTYIELGDGDDLWEVRNIGDIVSSHESTFRILKSFNDNNRLIMLFGNHDIVKKNKRNFYGDVLGRVKMYESIVLNYKFNRLMLLHGHQVDLLNSKFWRLQRFLVRHVWKKLETLGVNDPTSAAKNYKVANRVEKRLSEWANENEIIVIAGHTHRPVLPKNAKSLYLNDGSCVHPNGITALEIEYGHISLVRWKTNSNEAGEVIIDKEIIDGNILITDYFNS